MGIDNPVHLLFLGVIALIVLGPRRLPELAKSLGKGMRELREAMSEGAQGDRTEGPYAADRAPEQPALPSPASSSPPVAGESRPPAAR